MSLSRLITNYFKIEIEKKKTVLIAMERYYMTSRRPYWCTKPILRELNSIFTQRFSFVSVKQYGR